MLIEFNRKNRRLSFSDPGMPGMAILEGIAWVRYRTEAGNVHRVNLTGEGCSIKEDPLTDVHDTGRQLVVRCPANQDGIELTCRVNTYDQQSFALLQLSLSNLGRARIYLDEYCCIQANSAAGGRVELSRSDEELCFFKVGWHGWSYTGLRTQKDHNSNIISDIFTGAAYTNPVTARPRSRGEFWSEGWGILAGAEVSLVAGFASTAHQFGQVYACIRPKQEALTLITQADGIRLDPGETSASEWGYLQFIPLPNPEPEADFVNAVARKMQARVPASPPPPMWTHWYHYYHDITEQLFLQNLEGLADNRAAVPYQVVELDDGYQSAWGDWISTNTKFPHGLSKLAEDISAKGFTPGLWLAPFVVQDKSQIAREHPDWLVKDRRGKPINTGFVYNLKIHALDLTHPAVLEHLHKLTDVIAHQWGYGMLKVDFIICAALPGKRYNQKLTRAESLRSGLETIRQGAGEETFLLGCGCPFGPAIGVVDAMRIGPDTAPAWEPYFHWLPWISPLIKWNPSMPSLRNAFRNTLNLSSLHQRWWWNDPDCLLVRDTDTRLIESEVQSAVSLVGLSGGMLVSSDDLRNLNPDRLKWVSLLVPNLGLRGMPLDLLEKGMPELYQVRLQSAGQSWQEVALFNWSDRPANCRVQFDQLGFESGAILHVFDFWHKRYQWVTEPEMVFDGVPPHGCKLLRVCTAGMSPQVVGDTMHISQGAELSSIDLEGEKLVIETVDMNRQVEGELWLWLPKMPKTATCGGKIVVIEDKGEGIYIFHLQFTSIGRVEVLL